MADIELVIKIPEEVYEEYKGKTLDRWNHSQLAIYIANGTPLPKGHGRLIDASKYEDNYFNVSFLYDDGNHIHEIYTREIPSIIEADKEGEDTK